MSEISKIIRTFGLQLKEIAEEREPNADLTPTAYMHAAVVYQVLAATAIAVMRTATELERE